MSFRDFIFGKKEEHGQRSTVSPQQEQLLSQYFSGQKGIGQNPTFQMADQLIRQMMSGNDQGMAAMQAPAMRQFQEEIIPSLSEMFTGMGAGGGRSSAQPLLMGKAAAGLQENLAAMAANRQMQALGMALPYAQAQGNEDMNLMNMRTFENTFMPRQSGFLENATLAGIGSLGGIMSGIGSMRQGNALDSLRMGMQGARG